MIWVKIGSLFMFLGVALGAFGAHALRSRLNDYGMDIFKTAVLYQFIHALALFVVAWLGTVSHDPKITAAGWMFTLGILLFSGSLYIICLTEIRAFGVITPLGGLSFLAGWVLLLLSSLK